MDLLFWLYQENRDTYYSICSYLSPRNLLCLSSCNRLNRQLIFSCEHRNLWYQWWKENVSEFVLPVGTLETQRREVCMLVQHPLSVEDYVDLGYDKLVYGRFTPRTHGNVFDRVIRQNQVHIFNQLFEQGYSISPTENYHLSIAIWNNVSFEIIDKLLDLGFDINAEPDANHNSPLLSAARRGSVALMKHLISRGANIRVREAQLLLEATGNRPVFEFLVQSGLDLSSCIVDVLNKIRGDIISFNGDDIVDLGVIEYLLRTQNVSPAVKTMLLDDLAEIGSLMGVKILLAAGAEMSNRTLYRACESENLEMVQLIHASGGTSIDDLPTYNRDIARYIMSHFELLPAVREDFLKHYLRKQDIEMVSFLREKGALLPQGRQHKCFSWSQNRMKFNSRSWSPC